MDPESGSGTAAVSWGEVEDAADDVFNIWLGHPEVAWARSCWAWLGEEGLTSYRGEVERAVVLLRLLALGEIYRDFCACAWDESSAAYFGDLAAELGVSPFRIAQYVGVDFATEDEMSDEDLLSIALDIVVPELRDDVAGALLKQAGSTSALFASMWLSKDPEHSGVRWDDLDPELRGSVLNEVTAGKLEAFGWIEAGMERFRPV